MLLKQCQSKRLWFSFGNCPGYVSGLITLIVCILLILPFGRSHAQKNIVLEIVYSDGYGHRPTIEYVDSARVITNVRDKVAKLNAAGYVHASLDTLKCSKDSCMARIYKGLAYRTGKIILDDEQRSVLDAAGFRSSAMGQKAVDSTTLYSWLKALVTHWNNNGFPFATARLDSLSFSGEVMDVSVMVNKGKPIIFDTIISEGRLAMRYSFFSRLLDIRSGDTYDHSKVLRANGRISDLQYATQRAAPYLRFVNNRATLVLTPDARPASRFDFLIGVLPQQTPDGTRKWNIAGDMTAELNNVFNYGEYTFFQFKRLKAENLELVIRSSIPYVAGLPVGTHLDFRIFKNGNSNLDLHFDGGVQYLFGGFNNIKLYGSFRSSTLLDVDIETIKSAKKLPGQLDVRYRGLGFEVNIRQLDYRFNPSRGYQADISFVAGSKRIIPNRQVTDLDGFETSYDSLAGNTLQLTADVAASRFFPVSGWAAIRLGMTAGMRYNQKKLLANEYIRTGGSRTIRGFDEESLLTDRYGIGTLEFRLLFDRNSYMTLPFIDAGFVRTGVKDSAVIKPVLGVGLGLNFGTGAGIFNLSVAAGKLGSNPLDFSKMKIHFGYVNLF